MKPRIIRHKWKTILGYDNPDGTVLMRCNGCGTEARAPIRGGIGKRTSPFAFEGDVGIEIDCRLQRRVLAVKNIMES